MYTQFACLSSTKMGVILMSVCVLCAVVTGATSGIGKAYAMEVNLQFPSATNSWSKSKSG